MPRAPLQFITIICRECQAIIALATPGAFLHTTHLKCGHCGTTRTIKAVDSSEPEKSPAMIVAGY